MADAADEALLIVDVQKDFCPGGALAAPGGDAIVPAMNRHIEEARRRNLTVYASRDWHPQVTRHFTTYGGTWPVHCVQDTPGASFHAGLQLPADTIVISKGDDPDQHGYSAFEGRNAAGTRLLDDLRARGIRRLYVGGIATDYCVRATVLDGLQAGLQVDVLRDAITGIDVRPGDTDAALNEMTRAGARIVDQGGFSRT